MDLSLIIPCRNERRHIRECVEPLLTCGLDDFEIIVADGQSDDGTREILAELEARDPRVRVIDNPGRTASAGLNCGIRVARGDVIVRIDAHTQYAPDYVRECLAVLRESGADNVGGPWIARGDSYLQRAIAAAFSSPFAVGGAQGHDQEYEGPLDTVYLGCWRRDVFDRIGLFDEELVRNQDDEFNLRLHRAGGVIWQSPRIKSWYTPRASLGALFKQYFQYGYWKVRVIQKHRLPASIRHLVPGVFAATLSLLVLFATFWPPARMALAGLTGIYLTFTLVGAVATAARSGWDLLPALPVVFATYHLAYGYGFLAGIVDFWLLKRSGRFTGLSRG